MTEDDAAEIEKAVDENSRVLIVGAGLIGLKCAEGLCGRVKSITVCDLAERVLSSILDEPCAKLMQNVLEENKVHMLIIYNQNNILIFHIKDLYIKYPYF